jgi:hypothetical protein
MSTSGNAPLRQAVTFGTATNSSATRRVNKDSGAMIEGGPAGTDWRDASRGQLGSAVNTRFKRESGLLPLWRIHTGCYPYHPGCSAQGQGADEGSCTRWHGNARLISALRLGINRMQPLCSACSRMASKSGCRDQPARVHRCSRAPSFTQ